MAIEEVASAFSHTDTLDKLKQQEAFMKENQSNQEKLYLQIRDSDDVLDEDAEDKEIMDSIKAAEKETGTKMPTPHAYKENPWSPIKYDIENVQLKGDFLTEDEDEDKEVMESLKYAEKQMGRTMKTPIPVKEHPWSPITYDFQNVQLKDDFMTEEEDEDR